MDSLRTDERSPRRLSLVILVIVFLMGFLLFSAGRRAAERSKHEKCLTNLRQIGLALHQYALDFDNVFPFGKLDENKPYQFLGLLHPSYAASFAVFACPGSSDTVIPPAVMTSGGDGRPFREDESEKGLSYAYGHNQRKPWTQKDPGSVRLVADKYATHDYVKDPFPEERPLNHSMGISFFGVRRRDVYRYGGRNYVQLDGAAPSPITSKFKPTAGWDKDIGPLEADPETEFDNSGAPKHDQTGPDWWSDPPDK